MMNVMEEFGELSGPDDVRRWLGIVTSGRLPRSVASTILRGLEVWADLYLADQANQRHRAEGWKLGLKAFQRQERRFAGLPVLEIMDE